MQERRSLSVLRRDDRQGGAISVSPSRVALWPSRKSFTQPNRGQLHLPNRKVSTGALAGALTVLLVAVLNKYLATPVPGEVSSAIMTILSFAAAYLGFCLEHSTSHPGVGSPSAGPQFLPAAPS